MSHSSPLSSLSCCAQILTRGGQHLLNRELRRLQAPHPLSGQTTASCPGRTTRCLAAMPGKPRHLGGEAMRQVLGAMAVRQCGSGRGMQTSGTAMEPSQKTEIMRVGSRWRPKGPAWLVGRCSTPAGTSRRAARAKQAGSRGMIEILAAHSLIAAGTILSHRIMTLRLEECSQQRIRRLCFCVCTSGCDMCL